ncbi:hypothetical protein ACFLTR_03545 [Chloroflexota bacterium]
MITVLTIIALVVLVLHWKGPNAVWGGATLGSLVGLIIGLVTGNWSMLALSFAVGTFAGTLFEWIGRLSKRPNYQSVINTQINLYNIRRRRMPELSEDEVLNKLISSRIRALPKAGSDEKEYYEPLLGNPNKSLEDVIYAMIHYEYILSRASEAITKGQEMGLTSDQITELWGDFGEKVRNDIRVSIRKVVANKSSN